jgi:hypothetical protein
VVSAKGLEFCQYDSRIKVVPERFAGIAESKLLVQPVDFLDIFGIKLEVTL